MAIKGAPEILLKKCTRIYVNGNYAKINDHWREKIDKNLVELFNLGHKVLAYCDFRLDANTYGENYSFQYEDSDKNNLPLDELRFLGLISINEQARDDVDQSVSHCKKAGIKVIMVTGDNPMTAKVMARSINVFETDNVDLIRDTSGDLFKTTLECSTNSAAVITGNVIDQLTEAGLDRLISCYDELVFARATPLHKFEIVKSLKRMDQSVAVTSDGVYESPSLKIADVSIARCYGDNDISREAADIILLDNNLKSIEIAILESRVMFDNLKKSVTYILASKIPEIGSLLLFLLVGIPLPIRTFLVTFIILVADIVPSVVISYQKPESMIMMDEFKDYYSSKLVNFRYGLDIVSFYFYPYVNLV